LPVILCFLATFIKAFIILILNLFMGSVVPVYSLASSLFWLELALNCVSAPLLFMLLKRFNFLLVGRN
jgi:hypothetical protein